MDKLDPLLNEDIETAIARAKVTGRFELADYLSLKATNDHIRRESVKWLFDTVREIVFTFNRHGAAIKIDEKENLRFKYGLSRLSGSLLELRKGVRCLTFEAGWTRTPDDSIIRGGSLAYSRISHFGFSKETEELLLHDFEGTPQWFFVRGEEMRVAFNVSNLKRHFEVFLS